MKTSGITTIAACLYNYSIILSKKSEWIFWTNAPKASLRNLEELWALRGLWFRHHRCGISPTPKVFDLYAGYRWKFPRIRHRPFCRRTLLQKVFIHKVFFDFALCSSTQPLAPNLLWKFRDTLFFSEARQSGQPFFKAKMPIKRDPRDAAMRHPSFLKITR